MINLLEELEGVTELIKDRKGRKEEDTEETEKNGHEDRIGDRRGLIEQEKRERWRENM